ncbi:type II toxin-antitoxin system HipA family toxin [Agrococcus sp. 1P02AA]|uniref:type II toxin-antitoxin system HipA family toxin n=1 Tax=Agrococcus sp. 1P02AA TaxID=3132259 RepID=UPI0039A506A4
MIQVTLALPGGREVVAGQITEQAGRGRAKPTPVFEYDARFIADPDAYSLSNDLPLGPGPHWPRDGRDMFAGFQDALPDSWAKRLLHEAHRRGFAARGEKVEPATDLELLLMVGDEHRQGALRFWRDGVAQRPDSVQTTPLELRSLAAAAERFTQGKETADEFRRLLAAGSTPGGYRPKTNVRDDAGHLLLAKFPLHTDPYDVSAWEEATMRMQKAAGIDVAGSRLMRLGRSRHAFITARFDREGPARLHYRSVAAIFGTQVGERIPYSRMAQLLRKEASDPRGLQRELFRRAAFNTLVRCTDDHMRNHGVIRRDRGWGLSPAFDVNPHRDYADATPLTEADDPADRDIRTLAAAHDAFSLSSADAAHIIRQCAAATDGWFHAGAAAGVEGEAIDFMARAFEHDNRVRAHRLSAVDSKTIDVSPGHQERKPAGAPRSTGGQFAGKAPPPPASHL